VYNLIDEKVHRKKSKQVKIGDILEIKKDEEFPADLVLLYAEDASNKPIDLIFIDTMNLDGEANLKPRTIIDSSISDREQLHTTNAHISYEVPNKDLEKWEGTFQNNN
jgi:P-type E1-E2 ATPase